MEINWAEIIAGLEADGMSQKEIGERIGLSPGSVCDIKMGRSAQPRGAAAVQLFDLHRARNAANGSHDNEGQAA